jgi:hypothetical protein
MRRVVKPELLDELSPSDPRAIGTRADLRRVNFIMGHAGIRSRALRRHYHETDFRSRPLRLIELGAGDGTYQMACQTGYQGRNQYPGKTYDEVEVDLRRDCEKSNAWCSPC